MRAAVEVAVAVKVGVGLETTMGLAVAAGSLEVMGRGTVLLRDAWRDTCEEHRDSNERDG